jgi:hypothetical protein
VRELKLFYILTAHETAEDLAAFGDFCSRLRAWLDAPGPARASCSSSGELVRMPNTPLAFDRLFSTSPDCAFCVDGVSAACRRSRLECRFAFGGRTTSRRSFSPPGHEHRRRRSSASPATGSPATRPGATGSPAAPEHTLLGLHRARRFTLAEDAPPRTFPFVSRAVSPAFLLCRWESARQFLDAGHCLGSSCFACGACAGADERRAITGHARALAIPPSAIDAVARLEADKRRIAPSSAPRACPTSSPAARRSGPARG